MKTCEICQKPISKDPEIKIHARRKYCNRCWYERKRQYSKDYYLKNNNKTYERKN